MPADRSRPARRPAGLVDERTRLVFGETICNPKLNVVDIDAWAEASHALGLPFIIDSTVATVSVPPYRARRRRRGAFDHQVHGRPRHLDGWRHRGRRELRLGGPRRPLPMMATPDASYHDVVWTDAAGPAAYITRARTVLMRNTGATLSPMNAWIILQGIESLHVRMDRHCQNAAQVADYLRAHPLVAWVNYPGFDDNPYHEIADRVLTSKGYGGLVSFGLQAGREAGSAFVLAVRSPGQHRGRQVTGDPQCLHDALAAQRDEELAAAGVAPRWCGCRSASRMSMTSSPTSSRLWTRPLSDAHQ